MSNVRFCVNYSDWLIIWFILYKFKIINYNPKFSILFGIIINFIEIIDYLIKNKLCFERFYIQVIIHFIIKIIEFYILLDTPFTMRDFKFNLIMFILYNIWSLKILKKTPLLLKLKNNIFNNKKKLEDYNEINKIKLDNLNNDYKNNFDDINKEYIKKITTFNNNLNQEKINKILNKYKNKVDKLYDKYEYNLKRNI